MGQYKQNKSKKATQSTKACSTNHQQRTRLDHTKKIFKSQKILNIYKLNILSVAVFMYQIRNKTAPLTFSGSFEKISHGYPTNFSRFNYKIPKITLNMI